MGRLPPRFFALTPGDLTLDTSAAFSARAQAAFEAGLPGLMLRESQLGDRDFLALARELTVQARSHGAWLCVHDRAHVALEVGADALHLGFRSMPPAAARSLLGARLAVGISTHAGDGPEAHAHGDYRVHGPVFATPSKRGWKEPIGLEGLEQAARASSLPLWAIGGLLPEHAAEVCERGAAGLCARGSVFGAQESPALAARRVAAWLAATSGIEARGRP